MGRYVTRTGVVVNVSDEKAEALGSQLAPLKEDVPSVSSKKSPRKSSKSDAS